ncbi:MAG: DeoR/GlpR transcriptional regulator [Rhizobiales bacterium]|nr:DeoR/GlpR family DNA-binding transcription regulator [Hyphomicrobiales bacterium]NRB15614.1 DeoR/GlpR transcriptional regulator [Hyphomicrobiales bacterium]
MHENERHSLILSVLRQETVVTVNDLVKLTNSSKATVRRDIIALDSAKKLRKIHGGVEALHPPTAGLVGRPFNYNRSMNLDKKRAIAEKAVEICDDNDDIIINGGTTTFQMVHFLARRRLKVFTNSFPIAEHLIHNSANLVAMPAGTIYREQKIILSPFENDGTKNFSAKRMFMGAQGISNRGIMEADPLIVQAEEKLINQADELIMLLDSSKFAKRSSLVVCALSKISKVITDSDISAEAVEMIQEAGIELIIVPVKKN